MLKAFWIYLKSQFCGDKELHRNLYKILKFYPANISLYKRALIHKSASGLVVGYGEAQNNERLEYLGDAILDAIVSDYLFNEFREADEGFLTQMRSKIVNGQKLFELAKTMGIASLVVSNTNNERSKKRIYEDAFEAFIGAIYLDKGYRRTRKFVLDNVIGNHLDIDELEATNTNYKSQLIEWGQKHKKHIEFQTDLENEESNKFISHVRVESKILGSGIGISKKEAEQRAAKETLTLVEK